MTPIQTFIWGAVAGAMLLALVQIVRRGIYPWN